MVSANRKAQRAPFSLFSTITSGRRAFLCSFSCAGLH
jgi:hypothetical protein